MADPVDELVDFEEEDEVLATLPTPKLTASGKDSASKDQTDKSVKKGYVGIHSTGFRDFLLKPELLRSIADCGFEHPSEGS